MDSSDDFFNSFDSRGAAGANTAARNRRRPPPPPPNRGTTTAAPVAANTKASTATTSVGSTYYGSGGGTRGSTTAGGSLRRPPPKAKTAAAASGGGAFGGASSTSGPHPTTASSYYGSSSATATNGTNFARTSQTQSTPTATSPYYGSSQQQPVASQTNTTASSSSDWYSSPTSHQSPDQWVKPQQETQASSSAQLQQPLLGNNTTSTSNSNLYAGSASEWNPAQQQYSSSNSLQGTMDSSGRGSTGGFFNNQPSSNMSPQPQQPTIFQPTLAPSTGNSTGSSGYDDYDFANEPPLLEELGINIDHIILKTKAVVIPFRRFARNSALMDPTMIVEDADLAGPLVFALALGGELLLSGKIHFGYIYGFGLFGCLAMTLVLNLMSPKQAVSFWTVTSILGYSLLPVNVLAAVKLILVNIANLSNLGRLLGLLTVIWSTTASTRLLEVGCGMVDQRYLMAYPIALLYSAFVLITIF